MARFHSFLQLKYPIVYLYHIFIIHSSVDEHSACFQKLVIVNKAAVSTSVHISLPISVSIFFRLITRSEFSGSCGSLIFNLLRKLHTVFSNGCMNLYFCQQGMRVPFSLHLCQHMLFVFFVIAILASVR